MLRGVAFFHCFRVTIQEKGQIVFYLGAFGSGLGHHIGVEELDSPRKVGGF